MSPTVLVLILWLMRCCGTVPAGPLTIIGILAVLWGPMAILYIRDEMIPDWKWRREMARFRERERHQEEIFEFSDKVGGPPVIRRVVYRAKRIN